MMMAYDRTRSREEEIKIIRQAKTGDAGAVEWIVSSFLPMIRAAAGRCFLSHDAFSKEDLVHAGVLGLLESVKRYSPEAGTVLATYAMPWILGEIRRTIRASVDLLGVSVREVYNDAYGSVFDRIVYNQDAQIDASEIRWAVSLLDAEERQLVMLRYYRDRTQTETARLMGKSQAQISRIEHRALEHLRKLLG